MNKNLTRLAAVAAAMLIIPAAALVRTETAATSAATATVSEADKPAVIETANPLKTPQTDAGKSAGDILYKVYNHKTKKVMSLKASDYIKGVVAAEISASYHPEALKAQAVAANTYALRLIAQNNTDKSLKGAYFSTDPDKYQAYKSKAEIKKTYGADYESAYQKISDAVDAVIDQVIVYQDEPIAAVFHSVSGGVTESAKNVWGSEISYLQSVKSEADVTSPEFNDAVTLSAAQVEQTLKAREPKIRLPLSRQNWFKITSRSNAGGVMRVQIGNRSFSGGDLRLLFGLQSTNFTVAYQDDRFTFTTKGHGHGVGLSQYGANQLALQGKTYIEILKHYYTGVEIQTIS